MNLRIRESFSILIPVYNEEEILESSVSAIIANLEGVRVDHEILLCENGSTDRTVEICRKLKRNNPRVDWFSLGEPNYGKALQKGIRRAKHERIVVFEIDYYDMDFLRNSVQLLENHDLVVGSKRAKGAVDRRPLFRRLITLFFNLSLKFLLGFKGTDTHGLKAMKKTPMIPCSDSCRVFNNMFTTELVIRAERAGLRKTEIPATVEEMREARVGVWARVPRALRNLLHLVWVIRFQK